MTDYTNIVNDLLGINDTMFAISTSNINIDKISIRMAFDKNWHNIAEQAAAAIEALQAELPKRGEWIDSKERMRPDMCSVCGCVYEADRFMDKIAWHYCPNCGAKMNDSNALNALDNAQDGPIITPCRGCSDYDGYGGCKSKGGCARAKMEVQE